MRNAPSMRVLSRCLLFTLATLLSDSLRNLLPNVITHIPYCCSLNAKHNDAFTPTEPM